MENILSINLSTTTAPVVSESRSKHWVDYGTEDWANLYPQFLIDLYYNSSTASGYYQRYSRDDCWGGHSH